MKIKEYQLKSNYRAINADICVDYESAVQNINQILEEISRGNKNFDLECYESYKHFFECNNKFKAINLDTMKEWHEKLDSFIKIFSYQKSVCEKMEILSKRIEKFFETYSYMIDRVEKIKKSYDAKLEEFKLNRVLCDPLTDEEMETYFKQTARFYFDLENQMDDFIDDNVRPQIDLCDIIFSMELDFDDALMYHSVSGKLKEKVGDVNENSKL